MLERDDIALSNDEQLVTGLSKVSKPCFFIALAGATSTGRPLLERHLVFLVGRVTAPKT